MLARDQWEAKKAALSRARLRRITLTTAENFVPFFEAALEPEALSITLVENGDQWRVEALIAGDVDLSELRARILIAAAATAIEPPALIIEPVPDTNWVTAVQASMPAFRAGRYHVHGSHLPPDCAGGIVNIEIDAGLAFGTGDHESTQGCLLALDTLADRLPVSRALDMGCGTGLLAIAMAKSWEVPVIAADIDPLAVVTARDNARKNRIGDLIEMVGGDGYNNDAVKRGAPYDLITANILAGPLIAMAAEPARHLAPQGVAILAGLLACQEDAVIKAHQVHGLTLRHRIPLGDWRCLMLSRTDIECL